MGWARGQHGGTGNGEGGSRVGWGRGSRVGWGRGSRWVVEGSSRKRMDRGKGMERVCCSRDNQ